jgi:hypothetical protein
VTPLTVMPLVPPPVLVTVIVGVPKKFVPIRVTPTVAPRAPTFGVIEVSVGGGGVLTVNVTALLVPPLVGAVTVTFLAVCAAPAVITKLALTWVSLTTVMPVAVTPVPDTVIALVPVSPVPKRLTGTVVPTSPALGEIDVSTGPVTV